MWPGVLMLTVPSHSHAAQCWEPQGSSPPSGLVCPVRVGAQEKGKGRRQEEEDAGTQLPGPGARL